MSLGINISIPRKILLFLVEVFIKILWVFDKVTSLDLLYIGKTLLRTIFLAIPLSFLVFLGYSISTGYLHKLYIAYFFPDTNIIYKNFSNKPYPVLTGSEPLPQTTALSLLAIDKKSNKTLVEKNINISLAPASTAKLMTAIISLDIYDLEEVLAVSDYCTEVEGTKAFLPVNKIFKMKDLLNSMLIGSAGDSACVLATSKMSEQDFVEKMNEKVGSLGMTSTHFSNPVGLDDAYGNNYSNTLDLYKLAVYATSISEIKKIVGTKDFYFTDTEEDVNLLSRNTNRLLWEIPNSVGVKTGTTFEAGEVLIYEYDDGIKDIIIVVMGSKNRFADTKNILSWIGRNYSWKIL